jgi:hypothetical protein
MLRKKVKKMPAKKKKLNSLQRAARAELLKQYKSGKGKSRNEYKKKHGNNMAQYHVVSSQGSCDSYLKSISNFCCWSKQEHKIHSWAQLTDDIIAEYISVKEKDGTSKKTVQCYCTAINHVMIGKHLWEADEAISRIKLGYDRNRNNSRRYKNLTAAEYRQFNSQEYQKYKQHHDIARAFGLRREEIFGAKKKKDRKKGKNGITVSSFRIDEKGCMYIETVGKGGLYRIAKCRKDMNDQMRLLYGQYALAYEDLQPRRTRKATFVNKNRKSKRLFEKGISDAVPMHINRAEYAQKRFLEIQEELEVKYSGLPQTCLKNDYKGYSMLTVKNSEEVIAARKWTQIGAYKGYVEAFMEVSKELGHGRLDVLLKYMT